MGIPVTFRSAGVSQVRAPAVDSFPSRRIQKRLGYLSPIEFEEKHYADQATAERTNLKPRQPVLTS
ncbi:hypothetical protein ACFXPY_35150 [Streptomyces sp. NPDC059153]|uniref:hypothetical protein n=1 Tax=Streptomyces sp. NPDC059153 TaxID=3346743 RepID=UPI0036873497